MIEIVWNVPAYAWYLAAWLASGVAGLGVTIPAGWRSNPRNAVSIYENSRKVLPLFALLGPIMFAVARKEICDRGYGGFVICQTTASRKAEAIQEYARKNGNDAVLDNWFEVWRAA